MPSAGLQPRANAMVASGVRCAARRASPNRANSSSASDAPPHDAFVESLPSHDREFMFRFLFAGRSLMADRTRPPVVSVSRSSDAVETPDGASTSFRSDETGVYRQRLHRRHLRRELCSIRRCVIARRTPRRQRPTRQRVIFGEEHSPEKAAVVWPEWKGSRLADAEGRGDHRCRWVDLGRKNDLRMTLTRTDSIPVATMPRIAAAFVSPSTPQRRDAAQRMTHSRPKSPCPRRCRRRASAPGFSPKRVDNRLQRRRTGRRSREHVGRRLMDRRLAHLGSFDSGPLLRVWPRCPTDGDLRPDSGP